MKNAEKIFIILLFFLSGCEKNEDTSKKEDTPKYDIFPINVGNEYFYNYSYTWDKWNYGHTIRGKEKWVVVSKSTSSANTTYSVERTLSGVYVNFTGWTPSSRIYDTTHVYIDSVSYLNISEELFSSFVSFSKKNNCYYFPNTNLYFPRYIDKTDTVIHIASGEARIADFYLSTNSGLTKYSFFKFGNSGTESETLDLYRLKLNQ